MFPRVRYISGSITRTKPLFARCSPSALTTIASSERPAICNASQTMLVSEPSMHSDPVWRNKAAHSSTPATPKSNCPSPTLLPLGNRCFIFAPVVMGVGHGLAPSHLQHRVIRGQRHGQNLGGGFHCFV